MLRSTTRSFLKRFGKLERFRDSDFHRSYLKVFRPEEADKRSKEYLFYNLILSEQNIRLVFDIGASEGNKTSIFLQNAEQVVCVEPNPESVKSLRRRYRDNPKVKIVQSACGDHPGLAKLRIFEKGLGYSTLSEKWSNEITQHRKVDTLKEEIEVSILTLDNLIDMFGCPDYIKIDVEGLELNVLRGLSRLVPLISFECNLPTFKTETLKIIENLLARDEKGSFNFSYSEPPEHLAREKWLSGSEMIEQINSDKCQFMEVFFRASADIFHVRTAHENEAAVP